MQFSNYQLRNNVKIITLKLHFVIIYCIYRHLFGKYLIMILSKLIHYCHPLLRPPHLFSKSSFIADNARSFNITWLNDPVDRDPDPSVRASKTHSETSHQLQGWSRRKFGRSPADSWLPVVSPFFGLTSCSCGERAGRRGSRLCWCSAAANPPVYLAGIWQDSLWHLYPEGYRAIRCIHRNTLVDYLSFVAGPAGSTRNGNWLSTGRAGMSSADDMTSPSGYPYRAILVIIIVSNIVNSPEATAPMTSTQIRMQIARCAIQYARLHRTCSQVFRGVSPLYRATVSALHN